MFEILNKNAELNSRGCQISRFTPSKVKKIIIKNVSKISIKIKSDLSLCRSYKEIIRNANKWKIKNGFKKWIIFKIC